MGWVEILENRQLNVAGTAKEWGVAPATLCAMARRGLVNKSNSSPAKYAKLPLADTYCNIMKYVDEYNMVDIYKDGEQLGMLCLIKGNDILDCYGESYDITGVSGRLVWDDSGKAHRIPFCG